MKGIIVKGIAGFYYVESGNHIYQCKARGLFKKNELTPIVGDNAEFSLQDDGDGYIEIIGERKNSFIRPPVANVDAIIAVVSASKPKVDLFTLDKLLVTAEKSGADVLICVNKADEAGEKDMMFIEDIYGSIYKVIRTSAVSGLGIDVLCDFAKDKKCALAGPSGVGKSTLINGIFPDASSVTGEISEKSSRGKHTTRHVEIFKIPTGGYVYDTPGFTSFDVPLMEEEELQFMFPEFEAFIGKCKYDNCRHIHEPECAVMSALKENKIKKSRYDSYIKQLEFIRENNKY